MSNLGKTRGFARRELKSLQKKHGHSPKEWIIEVQRFVEDTGKHPNPRLVWHTFDPPYIGPQALEVQISLTRQYSHYFFRDSPHRPYNSPTKIEEEALARWRNIRTGETIPFEALGI